MLVRQDDGFTILPWERLTSAVNEGLAHLYTAPETGGWEDGLCLARGAQRPRLHRPAPRRTVCSARGPNTAREARALPSRGPRWRSVGEELSLASRPPSGNILCVPRKIRQLVADLEQKAMRGEP